MSAEPTPAQRLRRLADDWLEADGVSMRCTIADVVAVLNDLDDLSKPDATAYSRGYVAGAVDYGPHLSGDATTTTEWGVRYDPSFEITTEHKVGLYDRRDLPWTEADAKKARRLVRAEVFSRQRTTYPDRVTEWAEVEPSDTGPTA